MGKADSSRGLNRRDFVKTGIAAGISVQALPVLAHSAPAAVPDRWDHSADIIIAGAGTAGLSAAIEALDHGASVILVEEN